MEHTLGKAGDEEALVLKVSRICVNYSCFSLDFLAFSSMMKRNYLVIDSFTLQLKTVHNHAVLDLLVTMQPASHPSELIQFSHRVKKSNASCKLLHYP